MANWIMLIVAAVIIGLFVVPMALPGLTMYALLGWGILIALVINATVYRFIRLPKKTGTYVWVGAIVFAFLVGSFAPFGISTATLFPGTIGPGPGPGPIPSTECAASVADDIRGTSATVTVYSYDYASNSPATTSANNAVLYFKNGEYRGSLGVDTAGGSITNVAVGETLTFYDDGTNSSGYTEQKSVCVDAQRKTVNLISYNATYDERVDITCYDDTGGSVCSTGTNSSSEDYDITMGADEETTFYLKVKNSAPNTAFRLGGVATIADQDVDSCKPVSGQGFTEIAVPEFLDATVYLTDVSVYNAVGTGNETVTGWDNVWVLSSPLMLLEWESVKYQFTIESGSNDPTTSPGLSDVCAVVFLDSTTSLASDLSVKDMIYQDSDSQSNIGVIENTTHPLGGADGVVIEAI